MAAPPGGSRGRAHGYPGLPIGRPFGAWPDCRPCAECSPLKFIGGLSQTAMGATLALGATTFIPGLRLPVLSCFPAVVPRFAPSCVGAGCGDSLPGSTPRFWAVSQENGPEFDVLPGFWAVVSVPRCDSRRRLRYNPRSEAFTSLVPRSAAYETAQNFARELASRFFSVSRQICTHHRYVPPTSGTCTAIGCRCWRRGGSRCRWAHRRVARFRVRRRNPAGQAQGLRSRVALRR